MVQEQEAKELQDHDVFKAEKQKVEVELTLSSLRFNYKNKEKMLQDKLTKEKQATNILRNEQEILDQGETKIIEVLDELLWVAQEVAYDNHGLAAKDFERSYGSGYTFAHWKMEVSMYRQKLEMILKKSENKGRRVGNKIKLAKKWMKPSKTMIKSAIPYAKMNNYFLMNERSYWQRYTNGSRVMKLYYLLGMKR